MTHATNQPQTASHDQDRPATGLPFAASLEAFSQKATDFVSGPWGTLTLFAILALWALAIPFVGWSRSYQTIDEFITVASFILLFLIQRSQSKGMLSLQVKLNELLAAAHRASPELINVEDRSESEVREIHDRFQEIQQRGPGAHSLADIRPGEQTGRMSTAIAIRPQGEMVTVPAIIANAGDHAARRFLEFFTAAIRNPNTRRAYARAVGDFFARVAATPSGPPASSPTWRTAAPSTLASHTASFDSSIRARYWPSYRQRVGWFHSPTNLTRVKLPQLSTHV